MRYEEVKPYISIVFVNRNDNYSGDQNKRIEAFIDYYSYYDHLYPNLFEILVCDWNPPSNTKQLKVAYPWEKFSRVRHFVVDEALHKKLCPDNSRPILDYVGRNVCIRRAQGSFILIINQDIFLSSSIIEFFAQRKLKEDYFYRGDRCDFSLAFSQLKAGKEFDENAFKKISRIHMRPIKFNDQMSRDVNIETSKFHMTTPCFWEEKSKDNLIYGKPLRLLKVFKKIFKRPFLRRDPYRNYKQYLLHTNAGGDFLLASKEAFEKIKGFVETYKFYMHTDSYGCIQLFAAGYSQAIFSYPHIIFHLDHSRKDREARPESMTYKDHTEVFSDIIDGKKSYQLNGDDWGLSNYTLEA